MRFSILAMWALAALTIPLDAARASFIDFETPTGDCVLNAPVGGPAATFHIVAYLDGDLDGLLGAEFAVVGLPEGYLTTVTPNPANSLFLGNPLGLGTNLGFPSCQTGTVLLFTVSLFNLSDTSGPRTLRVVDHQGPPTDPDLQCPLVTRCDPPDFTRVCVSGGVLYLNPAPTEPPHDPSPVDGAEEVSIHPILSFDFTVLPFCDTHAAQELVYFGTDPDPPLVATQFDRTCSRPCYDPGVLQPFTTYYWRIHETDAGAGPVWRFTTGEALGVERAAWGEIKRVFR